MARQMYDGQTFEHRGRTFQFKTERDDTMQEPWKEHDGHGVISDWTRRDKLPGERVLVTDRSSRRYYHVIESMRLARKDGWGCSHSTHDATRKPAFVSGHATKREAIACAVDEDFERMRRWCTDDWYWCGVIVTLMDEDADGDEIETSERESLWGIESDAGDYFEHVARELADEIMARVEVDTPDVQLSEN